MTVRFSQSRLIDQRRFGHRTRFLGQKAFRAYFDLTEYYWEFGRLFSEDGDLADVCGLHVQAFRRIKEQLSRLFEVDDAGLWRDPELEAERARAMRKSATNRENGRKGGQARWTPEDPEGMGWGPDGAADLPDDVANSMATGMANAMTFAMPVATENESENGRSGMAGAMAVAMPPATSGGSIDRSSVEDSETIDRSNPHAGEREAMANGMAIASPVAIAAEASGSVPAIPAQPADAGPSDADLHARVLSACGANITAELRQSRDVEPIRALMRDGFDIEREILPLLRDRVKAFGTPLRTLRGKWIRRELEKVRAVGPASRVEAPASAAPPTAFVPSGTPEWDACQAREAAEGRKPKKAIFSDKSGQKGSWFPVPLPSAVRPSIAAE